MLAAHQNVEVLLFFVAAIVFLWHMVKDAEWKALSGRELLPSLKPFAAICLPFLFLFGVAALAQFQTAGGALFFLVGFAAPHILNKIRMAPYSRSLLLLMMSVGICFAIPQEGTNQLTAIIAGMLVWRCAASLLDPAKADLGDVLPSIVWLSTTIWSLKGGARVDAASQQGLILGTLAVAMFVRWVQRPLLKQDPAYLKRIVLAIVGGLLLLVVTMKLLLASHLDRMSLLAGAGLVGAYVLQSMEREQAGKGSYISALKQVLLIGIYTVVATRLFGTLGTLVLASTVLVAAESQVAEIAAFFWVGRALTQAFITQFNPNVTGVNLNHAYTSAALYGGFLFAVIALLSLRDLKERRLLTVVFLAAAVILPASANFFIHSEPTCSLLVSSCVSCLIIALFAAPILREELPGANTLVLAPSLMAISAALACELIESGNAATSQQKLTALGIIAFLLICLALIGRVFKSGPAATAKTAPVTGVDQSSD